MFFRVLVHCSLCFVCVSFFLILFVVLSSRLLCLWLAMSLLLFLVACCVFVFFVLHVDWYALSLCPCSLFFVIVFFVVASCSCFCWLESFVFFAFGSLLVIVFFVLIVGCCFRGWLFLFILCPLSLCSVCLFIFAVLHFKCFNIIFDFHSWTFICY